jgi:WD40 repeat protein
MIEHHDVAAARIQLGIEKRSSIGRDAQPWNPPQRLLRHDGELHTYYIAVYDGRIEEDGNDTARPTVHIYDVSSGRKLVSQIHDTIKAGRLQWLNASFGHPGIEFSADGRYLITSGKVTKVWRIRESTPSGTETPRVALNDNSDLPFAFPMEL